MDPLVRAALTAQYVLVRSAGTVASLGFGAYLVRYAAQRPTRLEVGVVALALAVLLAVRAWRRFQRLTVEETTRVDLELFTLLVVAAYAVVLHAPGGLDGPYSALVYALMMLTAGFARPWASFGAVLTAIAVEAGLRLLAFDESPEALAPHAGLLATFALLNFAIFRAEIARVRRVSRSHLEGELKRLREDARSYRLLGAPSSAVEPASSPFAMAPKGDPDRLLRSSVHEIHATLELVMALVRTALGLKSAVLLWLVDGGRRLIVREISTESGGIQRGPFDAAEGIFGAALKSRQAVSLHGPRVRHHVPYYEAPPLLEGVCAVPVVEHGHGRGLLVVDRESDVPFEKAHVELLEAVTRFVLRVIENERVFVQLERAKVEQGKLYRAVDQLSGATTEAEVIEAGVSSAREFASFDFAVVTLFHRKGNIGIHEICAASGDGADDLVGQTFRHNAGLVSMVVANRHPLPYRGDYEPDRQMVFTRRIRPPDMPSLVVLPLMVHDAVLGTLLLGSNAKGAFGEAVRPTLEVLARHVAVSLQNARMVKRLEDLATTDGLTGHLNKRALTEVARQKIRSAARFKKPLSLLVCDIDHFKRVNDTYGHDVGDVVIKGFAEVLRRSKRETDAVGRFGGEEFVVVCEETDAAGAELLADRIRTELESTTFHTEQGTLSVTCSVGAATYPRAGAEWESLFKATDEALYVSKRSGRNRVTVWAPKMRGAAA